jgi:hypothetical protein
MIFEWSIPGLAVAASWALSVSGASVAQAILGFFVFSSTSVSASLLLLVAIQILAFVRICTGTRRERQPIALRWFSLVLFGGFLALIGSAVGEVPEGRALVIAGLLLMVPNVVTTFFFGEFLERQTIKSYLGSVLIPAFVAIDILLKIKAPAKADFGQVFEGGLMALGGATLIFSSLLAFLRLGIRSVLIHWSQAWIGLALFLLPFEFEAVSPVAIPAIAIFAVSSLSLLGLGAQLGQRPFAFARAVALGLPGFIGFLSLDAAIRIPLSADPWFAVPVFVGQLLLIMTMVSCKTWQVSSPDRRLMVRFWIITGVQLAAGCGLHWLGRGVIQ